MDTLEEAKEIMEKIGCNKVFAVYNLELENIDEVRSCNEKDEAIEVEMDISRFVSNIEQKLILDQEKTIKCPLNSLMSKYLEFSLKNKSISPFNVGDMECKKLEEMIKPLLYKYQWTIKKR
jgi:hypothetical protein